MPYIKDEDKHEMTDSIENLKMHIESKGDLTYAICQLVGKVILDSDKISYTGMSECISAVHDAEMELRRRLLNLYEDFKMFENGDVPSFKGILARIHGDAAEKALHG